MNKMYYFHIMEYYSTTKRNEAPIRATTLVSLWKHWSGNEKLDCKGPKQSSEERAFQIFLVVAVTVVLNQFTRLAWLLSWTLQPESVGEACLCAHLPCSTACALMNGAGVRLDLALKGCCCRQPLYHPTCSPQTKWILSTQILAWSLTGVSEHLFSLFLLLS